MKDETREAWTPESPKHWLDSDVRPEPDDADAYLRPNLWTWSRALDRIDLHVGVDERTADPVLVNLKDLREVCGALSMLITSTAMELDGLLPSRRVSSPSQPAEPTSQEPVAWAVVAVNNERNVAALYATKAMAERQFERDVMAKRLKAVPLYLYPAPPVEPETTREPPQ